MVNGVGWHGCGFGQPCREGVWLGARKLNYARLISHVCAPRQTCHTPRSPALRSLSYLLNGCGFMTNEMLGISITPDLLF